jgi:hypothetical protein
MGNGTLTGNSIVSLLIKRTIIYVQLNVFLFILFFSTFLSLLIKFFEPAIVNGTMTGFSIPLVPCVCTHTHTHTK